MEAGVLEHADIARKHGRDRPLRLRPLAILDEPHRAPRQPVSGSTSWAVDMSGRTSPLGRPKCDSRSTIAPRSLSSSTVGSIARSRVSSVTLAPSIGTLRSTRTSTFLPVRSLRQVVQGLEIAHLPARMFTNVRSNTRARAGRGEVHANGEHMQPGKRTAHESAIMETEPCRTALFISRAWPSPRRCRPCGSRSPIHCRTS